MKFTVLWHEDAERELIDLWLTPAHRSSVTEAANRIDDELRHHADSAGEGRMGRERILFVPPLGVLFECFREDRLARVLGVWQYRFKDRDS